MMQNFKLFTSNEFLVLIGTKMSDYKNKIISIYYILLSQDIQTYTSDYI